MLKIAMLSFAHVHANSYARQVSENPDTMIQVIWDDDPVRGKIASEQYHVPYSANLEDVVSNPDIDAVVINSYTSQHPWVMKAALKHNKHIFTEKALTISTKDADEIVSRVHESGIKFMISLPSRTSSEILFMKDVLDKGWLGKITLMRARVAHPAALDVWFTKENHNDWFGDEELAGGGALFDLGCHTVDVMRWFMGKPKRMTALIQNFSGTYNVDDNSVIAVEFENGGLGILDTAFVHRAGPNPIEIYGTDGYLGRDPNGGLLLNSTQLQAGGVAGYIKPTKLPNALPMPMQQWVSAILKDTPMTITVEDGRNLTEMLEGAYRAAREGREIQF